MIVRLGELSLSDVVPLLADMQAALTLAQGFAVPELEAKLAGLANVLAAITVAPPSLGATITAALSTVASLQASISGPTATLQVSAIATLIAQLELQLAALTVSISIPGASVSAYVYDGPSADIGVELQGAINIDLPGAPAHMNALILATASRTAWIAMGRVFEVGT
jgi:hypothetical protein